MTDVEILRGGNIKTGDTLPNLRVKLIEARNPFNLTDYDVSVRVERSDGDSLVVDSSATIDDATRGIVQYSWSSGETDESGTYLVEFVADNGTGSTITFPNDGYAHLYIEDGLGT